MSHVTPETVLNFLCAVDVELPKIRAFLASDNIEKVEQFLASAASNPKLLEIADKFFPGMSSVVSLLAPFAGMLDQIGPILDFFQTILDLICKVKPPQN